MTYEEYEVYWQSDWNGYEVGYPEVPVVGLYTSVEYPEMSFYVDTENGIILEVMIEGEEE